MYIQRVPTQYVDSASVSDDLERLLTVDMMFKRPCINCRKGCQCGSFNCLCQCSPDCPDAPKALSSEPEKYPVEQGVVPLVFAMSQLREIRPCWSCEGHLDPEGRLWKVPQVWFYASSPVYVSLVSQHVWQLHSRRELTYPWVVAVLAYGDIGSMTYSLQPDLNCVENPDLHLLQYDLKRIAADIVGHVMARALKSRIGQADIRQ